MRIFSFYVVFWGRETGIYTSWDQVALYIDDTIGLGSKGLTYLVMRSEVLYKVRSHGKSWGSHTVAVCWLKIEKLQTKQIRSTGMGRPNPLEARHCSTGP